MTYALDLPTTWFVIVGVLLTGYAVLDGFDLGVGALLPFAKTDADRRTMLNAIGPVWDGNEVWLIVGGGALFAAFPEVYATVFSGFYLAMVLLLLALIVRAVAIEFRGRVESVRWRRGWDAAFAAASALIALLCGVAIGNVAFGVPLDAQRECAADFIYLLQPHGLLAGLTTLGLFMMHGSVFLAVKTEGELQQKAARWFWRCLAFFVAAWALLTVAIWILAPEMTRPMRETPALWALPVATLLAVAYVPHAFFRRQYGLAFLGSCACIVGLMALFGLGMFPDLLRSAPHPERSLSVANASSSPAALSTMLTIALIGMPLVLAYTGAIYYLFRGKVKADRMHY